MTPPREGRHGAGRSASRAAGSAVASQFVVAGGSLVLQVVAARLLGAADFGTFALVLALVVVVSAVHQGLVGDALTVLGRTELQLRRALVTVQTALTGSAVLVGAVAGLVLAPEDVAVAPLAGLLLGLWAVEELGRRLFISQSQFGELLLNDAVYVVATLASLLAISLVRPLDLPTILSAMTLGSAAAIAVAVAQNPAEWRPTRPGSAALGTLLSFSGWRTAQLISRPLVLLTMRVLIASIAGRAALGAVEAARLLVAPAITVIGGVGSYLLPRLTQHARGGGPGGRRLVERATAVLVAGSVVAAGLALLLVGVLGPLVTGGDFEVDRWAVLGWGLYTCAFAASMPVVTFFTVRRLSRYVFLVRLVEYGAGLLAVVAVVLLGEPGSAPGALALGGFLAVWVLWRRAVRLWSPPGAVTAETGEGPPSPR